ncbi:MAG: hypothetical protein Q4B18_08100, partial [Bacillota bacterium]|nr:hypothetical protein [Bacillota bacterium]
GFQFHSNNDIWFRFRKAKSLIALGQITACKDIIQEIGKSKFKHWCLEELCFDLARLNGNVTECLKHAGKCATADPSHDMRVKFYENLAFYLDDQEKTEYAALHRQLVLHVRKEKDWPLKQRHSEWIIPENISQLTKRATLKQLNVLWNEWRNYGKEFHFGTIIRILNEDIDGFIHDDHGNKYYFKASDFTFRSNKPLAVGARVRFALEKRINKKYNTENDTAVEISYIE